MPPYDANQRPKSVLSASSISAFLICSRHHLATDCDTKCYFFKYNTSEDSNQEFRLKRSGKVSYDNYPCIDWLGLFSISEMSLLAFYIEKNMKTEQMEKLKLQLLA